MYKFNQERTRSAGEKIGLALFIAGVLHMALNETFLLSSVGLTVGGIFCVIISLLENKNV